VIDCVVDPSDQVFPVALEDVNTTDPPAQKVKGPPAEIVGVASNGFTVTVVGADVAEHVPFDTVTEYVPEVETVIDCVVAPVDQVFPVALEDVNTTDPPAQNVVGPPAVIIGVAGTGFTVTVVGADAAEHVPFDTVTEYVPDVVTVID
jgi:hypothetical protein